MEGNEDVLISQRWTLALWLVGIVWAVVLSPLVGLCSAYVKGAVPGSVWAAANGTLIRKPVRTKQQPRKAAQTTRTANKVSRRIRKLIYERMEARASADLPQVPSRSVVCADVAEWLAESSLGPESAVVVSLPDVTEMNMALPEWLEWAVDAAADALTATHHSSVTIFYQTDIRSEGTWISKPTLCVKAAERVGRRLLWHKIVCFGKPGTIKFDRPAYTHILAFTGSHMDSPQHGHPDVIGDRGPMFWPRGFGLYACVFICDYLLQQHSGVTKVIDLYSGVGSLSAVANAMGLDSVAVELSPKRCSISRRLTCDLTSWTEGRDAYAGLVENNNA